LDRSEPDPGTPDDQREQPQGTELPALRIEKVRGSIPLSSTTFTQVKDLGIPSTSIRSTFW